MILFDDEIWLFRVALNKSLAANKIDLWGKSKGENSSKEGKRNDQVLHVLGGKPKAVD